MGGFITEVSPFVSVMRSILGLIRLSSEEYGGGCRPFFQLIPHCLPQVYMLLERFATTHTPAPVQEDRFAVSGAVLTLIISMSHRLSHVIRCSGQRGSQLIHNRPHACQIVTDHVHNSIVLSIRLDRTTSRYIVTNYTLFEPRRALLRGGLAVADPYTKSLPPPSYDITPFTACSQASICRMDICPRPIYGG